VGSTTSSQCYESGKYRNRISLWVGGHPFCKTAKGTKMPILQETEVTKSAKDIQKLLPNIIPSCKGFIDVEEYSLIHYQKTSGTEANPLDWELDYLRYRLMLPQHYNNE